MSRANAFLLALCVAIPGFASTAHAQDSCAPQDEGEVLSERRLLRQMSLDILGRIPTLEEWAMLDAGASIDDMLLPAMLSSDEYFAQVREQHRALLWGSLGSSVDIASAGFRLTKVRGGGQALRAPNMQRQYRGRALLDCVDQEQPAGAYDENGRPIPIETMNGAEAVAAGCDPADGRGGSLPSQCRQEGWVMVAPYWDPENPIQVCAYDAQTLSVDSNGLACDRTNRHPWCGCREGLQECLPGRGYTADTQVRRALEEEPARIFEAVVREGRPYFEAFTTNESYINGPLSHYYRHLTGNNDPRRNGPITFEPLYPSVPEMAFSNESWLRVERDERNAGVLTTMSFLIRFASNRGRANRFFTAFRCEPFVPPAGGLPEDTSEHPNPNLRERVGCDSCHNRLEPLASHWGRWRQNGTHGFMSDELLPVMEPDEDCLCGYTNEDGSPQRNCSPFCNEYFVTGTNSDEVMVAAWQGYPLARAWLSDEETTNIEVGPAGLVDEPGEIASVASCTVRTVAQRLFGRELTQGEFLVWVPEMSASFAESGYNYTELVKAILGSQTYRSIR